MASGVSFDEFQALEQRVLRAVEIVKQERAARASAEAELGRVREELAAVKASSEAAEQAAASRDAAAKTELDSLHGERETVRRRVEKLLAQMDELG